LIISKTPLRISFFGGGTDYPDYFEKYGEGAVLGTAIDKFMYISICKFYSKLFDYSIRVSYRNVECVNSLDEIKHVPIRECLRLHGLFDNIEVNYTAELPAFTGLGSSSSFIIGMLNSLHSFKGEKIDKMSLAKEAITVERDVLKEAVGCQDQLFAAMGGFNLIKFKSMNEIEVNPVLLSPDRIRKFEDHLMLFYTGIKRRASDIVRKQIIKVDKNKDNLKLMRQLVDEGLKILKSSRDLSDFGTLLNQNWNLKKTLDSEISNNIVDKIYERGINAGAIGGKLLGAGGGGFILLFVSPENKSNVRNKLNDLIEIPIKISDEGSTILNGQ